MTDFSPWYRSLNWPPRGVAMCILCETYVHDVKGGRYRHGANFQPSAYVTVNCDPQEVIGEAEVSSYNAMSACKSTFESSRCWCSIWCIWYGLNSLKRWVGLPKGTVRGYPFGSWSLPMIWKLCCKLWLWHNMRICCIGYLQVMRLYNNDMIWEWKYFNLLTSISNRDSFWCDSIICYDVEW